MSWSRGYVSDAPYVTGYQPWQSPPHLALACALRGVAWEPRQRMVVGELGCGRGFTAVALAAASPDWTVVGLDYNPAHVAEARALAAEAGCTNAIFLEADLAAMSDAELDALPEFDLVTLHGLWTWVGDAVREGVVRLLRRRLLAGGLAMISYNSMPAFAPGFAVQRLVHADAPLHSGNAHERVLAALATVTALTEAKAPHLKDNPWGPRIETSAKGQNPAYLAHELLTEHWRPAFFADLAAALADAKLDYVGSATLSENFEELMLSPAQREVQQKQPTETGRELVKDLCLLRGFRKDVFVRGRMAADRSRTLEGTVLALAQHDFSLTGTIPLPAGEVALPAPVLAPTLRALAERPCSIAELLALPSAARTNAAELAMILVESGIAVPVWRSNPGPQPAATGFNRAVARRYADGGFARSRFALAAPAMAGALSCGAIEIAVVNALLDGVAPELAPMMQLLLPDDLQGELRDEAETTLRRILAERVPTYRALGIL